MQIEEAEHGSQSLEDTGDFASRLAAISNKSRGAASAMSCKTSDSDETILPIGQESLNRNAEDVSLDAGMSIISAKHSDQTAGEQSETGEGSKQEDVSRTEEGINQIKNEKDEEAEEAVRNKVEDEKGELAEERVQEVVKVIQDSFLQILEAGKEDLQGSSGRVGEKQATVGEKESDNFFNS